ncbi:12046_t:CDS:2 [Acaulospora morrowiae]|uniref:12046_t:CDS:1 n=1 Tax=Acaulospora morrowiae TaxID=94023 RepID=A0A9N8VMT9_9GLOM|nr:12046_t:CDS:2 [Acaulospora morrowiae]
MAFSSTHNKILGSVKWVPIKVNTVFGHETHLAKSVFSENSYLELKIFLDVERLPEYIQYLSEFLRERLDIEHKAIRLDDILLLESKRSVGPVDLVWSFSCKLIPSSLPNTVSPRCDSNEFIDGATALYTHFILPQLLLSSAYNQQVDVLHDYIKSKEEQFNETVRLMSLMRMESNKRNDDNSTSFTSEDSYQEIERIITSSDPLETDIPLDLHKNQIYSRLFQKATEQVIPPNLVNLPITSETLSCSSSVPSIFDFEQSSRISQCSTIKLPSLPSQISEIFNSQLSAYEGSTFEIPSPVHDASHSNVVNSDESQVERERIQLEEKLKAEADARERKIRTELKEMDRRNATKIIKKRKKITYPLRTFKRKSFSTRTQKEISHVSAITPTQPDSNLNGTEQATYLKRMQEFLSANDLSSVTKEFIELKNNNVAPNLEIYHILLKACHLTADLPSAIEIIKQMHNASKETSLPIKETYKLLLNVVAASSDHTLAISIVKSIANGQIPLVHQRSILRENSDPLEFEVDLEMWKLMLSAITTPHKLYGTRNMEYFEEVKNLGEMFLELHKRPFDKETWRLLIRSLGSYPKKSENFDLALKSLQEHSITPELYSEIIWALSRKSKVEEAMIYLDQLISDFGYIPSREPLYALTSYYADLGEYQETDYLIKNYAKLIKSEGQQPGKQENWEINFMTVLMQAYVQALRKKTSPQEPNANYRNVIPIVMREESVDYFSKKYFTKSPFYLSWKNLMESVKKPDSTFCRDHYDLIIRFNVLANRIDSTEFPLENCLQMIRSMRGNGMDPSFETYKFLLEGYSRSEFDGTSVQRVEKALEIFEMIRLAGYDVDNLQVFQPLLDSCLPNVKFETDRQTERDHRIRKKDKGVENISLLHEPSVPKIFEIEKLMKNLKVIHNQKSIMTILEYLGGTGNYTNMWRRWTEISLMGYRRGELLYETILRLASRDFTESEYAINVVRHQMVRETPPVEPTFGIYFQLFECCLKCNDILTIRELIEEIKNIQFGKTNVEHWKSNEDDGSDGGGGAGFFGVNSLRISKEDQLKLQALVLNTCFKFPVLHKDGEELARNVLEHRKDLIDFEFWRLLLGYYTEQNSSKVQETFETFVDWRNYRCGFKKLDMVEKEHEENADTVVDYHLGVTPQSEWDGKDNTSGTLNPSTVDFSKIRNIRLPIPPFTLKDIGIINIYGKNLIRAGNFSLTKEILTDIVSNFEISPKSTKSQVSLGQTTTTSLITKIDSKIIDMNILKEFAYLTFKQNKLDELRWLEKSILNKIDFSSKSLTSTSDSLSLSTAYSSFLSNDQREFAKKKDFEILSRWISKCLKASPSSSHPISPSRRNRGMINDKSPAAEHPASYTSYVDLLPSEGSTSTDAMLKSLNYLATKPKNVEDNEGGRGTKVKN